MRKAREILEDAEPGQDIDERHMHRATGWQTEPDDVEFSRSFDRSFGTSKHRETAPRRKLYSSRQWNDDIAKAEAKHARLYGHIRTRWG